MEYLGIVNDSPGTVFAVQPHSLGKMTSDMESSSIESTSTSSSSYAYLQHLCHHQSDKAVATLAMHTELAAFVLASPSHLQRLKAKNVGISSVELNLYFMELASGLHPSRRVTF